MHCAWMGVQKRTPLKRQDPALKRRISDPYSVRVSWPLLRLGRILHEPEP